MTHQRGAAASRRLATRGGGRACGACRGACLLGDLVGVLLTSLGRNLWVLPPPPTSDLVLHQLLVPAVGFPPNAVEQLDPVASLDELGNKLRGINDFVLR